MMVAAPGHGRCRTYTPAVFATIVAWLCQLPLAAWGRPRTQVSNDRAEQLQQQQQQRQPWSTMARQAREEGLTDVTDFMSTFEAHQRIADEVKCGVCVYLVVDMFNSGASYAASQGSQLPAYGPGSLSATVASTIAGLCDMETAAEDAPKRFLGLYDLRNGTSRGGGGGGWHVVREEVRRPLARCREPW
jgi:hypothetical protein